MLKCIEVKFMEGNVDKAERLNPNKNSKDEIGYLEAYKHVLYVNGWKWAYYDYITGDLGC